MSAEDTVNKPTTTGDATARLLNRPLDAKALQERTAQVAQALPVKQEVSDSVMIFRLGEEHLALPAGSVVCVRPRADIHRIPHRTNHTIRGQCNIDGQLVLCASLSKLLDVPAAATADSGRARMIVIGVPEALWAFEVDNVVGVVPVSRAALRQPPMTVERAVVHYTAALIQVDDIQAAVLDIERLLAGFEAALR